MPQIVQILYQTYTAYHIPQISPIQYAASHIGIVIFNSLNNLTKG